MNLKTIELHFAYVSQHVNTIKEINNKKTKTNIIMNEKKKKIREE